MISNKTLEDIRKNGIDLVLSSTKNYVNVYKKNKLVGSIFDTKNAVYFCGKEFVEVSGRELIKYLNSNA